MPSAPQRSARTNSNENASPTPAQIAQPLPDRPAALHQHQHLPADQDSDDQHQHGADCGHRTIIPSACPPRALTRTCRWARPVFQGVEPVEPTLRDLASRRAGAPQPPLQGSAGVDPNPTPTNPHEEPQSAPECVQIWRSSSDQSPGAGSYGSEGWGFESLRARQHKPKSFRWMTWACLFVVFPFTRWGRHPRAGRPTWTGAVDLGFRFSGLEPGRGRR